MYNIQPKTLFIGKNTVFLPTCHSTNDIAAELLQKSPEIEGTVVITNNQTAGRGQRGNNWKTNGNQNFTFSLILKPNFLLANDQFWLNIAVSLGVYDFFKPYLGENLKIKWPNDMYFSTQKLGGILIENTIQNSRLQYSIVGIGMNINQTDFEGLNATSLAKITGQSYNLETLLPELLEQLEKRYLQLRAKNFSVLKFDYLQNLFGYQELRNYEAENIVFEAAIMGVSETGKLVLKVEDQLKTFDFQEIKFVI